MEADLLRAREAEGRRGVRPLAIFIIGLKNQTHSYSHPLIKNQSQQKENKQPTHFLFQNLQNVKQDTNCHSWKLC